MRALRELLAGPVPAIVVPPRILRRVARRGRRGRGFRLPHAESHTLSREDFLAVVDPREVGLTLAEIPAGPVVLVARREAEYGSGVLDAAGLRAVWRARFHGGVHAAVDAKVAAGALDAAAIRREIDRIGQVPFDEAREVMGYEERLPSPAGDAESFVEFVALFLELHTFDRRALPLWFPSAAGDPRVLEMLRRYADPDALKIATHVPGAADAEPVFTEITPGRARVEWGQERRILNQRASSAARRGNAVRAAILEMRAGDEGSSLNRMESFLVRLRATWPEIEEGPWRDGLRALLRQAGLGSRSQAGKALFDLQKGCVEHERGVYTVDVRGFLWSLGRRPIRRELPRLREALVFRRLARAAGRIRRAGLAEGSFADALSRVVEAHEERLRESLRPVLRQAVEESGLRGGNAPERVARERAVASLLDAVCEHGRLRIGDLRDAISQNDVKLPQVRNPFQWAFRDPLLKADRRLARRLEGVYRRGEFYLRWLQRLSALFLGTRPGSLLVRYAALPFGGAYVLLAGLHHFAARIAPGVHFTGFLPVTGLGFFFFALLHWPRFRRGMAKVGRGIRKGAAVVFALPARLLRLRFLEVLFTSRAFKGFLRYVLRPAAGAAGVLFVLRLAGVKDVVRPLPAAGTFVAVSLLLYTPFFRHVEERAEDWLLVNWSFLRHRVLGGLFRAIMAGFRLLLALLDRVLYRVDEWLRFRRGDPRTSIVLKSIVKPVWGFIGYVVRFAVTLVVEPQINPIKHFPVVTVSHKIFLPFAPKIAGLFAPLGPVAANFLGGAMTLAIPGLCGFLAWELRENWRLFATNRPRRLQPVMIGHHGETMLRLLRPGFHSGTLPKAWRRLRRAPPGGAKERRCRENLHAVMHAVAQFVERHGVWLLEEYGIRARVGAVRAGGNGVRVELEGLVAISFEEQSGRIVAGVEELTDGVTAAGPVRHAVVGLLKRAGVDLVRGQVRVAVNGVPWDVADRGLVLWPDPEYRSEIVYPIRPGRALLPRDGAGPTLEARAVLFSEWHVTWHAWVEAWERGRSLLPHVPLV